MLQDSDLGGGGRQADGRGGSGGGGDKGRERRRLLTGVAAELDGGVAYAVRLQRGKKKALVVVLGMRPRMEAKVGCLLHSGWGDNLQNVRCFPPRHCLDRAVGSVRRFLPYVSSQMSGRAYRLGALVTGKA